MDKNDDPNNEIPFLSQDTNDLAIGNMSEDDRIPFEGTIDDVRVYNYALSAPEIAYIATDETADWVVVSAVAFGRRVGKTVIVVRDHPGFWVNRILAPYLNEAVRLVEEGVDVIGCGP